MGVCQRLLLRKDCDIAGLLRGVLVPSPTHLSVSSHVCRIELRQAHLFLLRCRWFRSTRGTWCSHVIRVTVYCAGPGTRAVCTSWRDWQQVHVIVLHFAALFHSPPCIAYVSLVQKHYYTVTLRLLYGSDRLRSLMSSTSLGCNLN